MGPPADLVERLRAELRGGDDPALWDLAARRFLFDVEATVGALEHGPRHLVVALARVPARAGIHPDEQATLRLAWERGRGGSEWTFAGSHPHVRRRRGAYSGTLCVPAGTRRLAFVEAVSLWRPRAPWAPPEEHETGRRTYRFQRGPDGGWRYQGAREP